MLHPESTNSYCFLGESRGRTKDQANGEESTINIDEIGKCKAIKKESSTSVAPTGDRGGLGPTEAVPRVCQIGAVSLLFWSGMLIGSGFLMKNAQLVLGK